MKSYNANEMTKGYNSVTEEMDFNQVVVIETFSGATVIMTAAEYYDISDARAS